MALNEVNKSRDLEDSKPKSWRSSR